MSRQFVVHHRSGFAGASAMLHAAATPPNDRRAASADDTDDDTPLALTMGELHKLIDGMVRKAVARGLGKVGTGRAASRDAIDDNGRRVSVHAAPNLPPECLGAPTVRQAVEAVIGLAPGPLLPPPRVLTDGGRRARGAGTIAALNRAMAALGQRGGAQ